MKTADGCDIIFGQKYYVINLKSGKYKMKLVTITIDTLLNPLFTFFDKINAEIKLIKLKNDN